jgi:anaerobic C4-dicarboxylate transporter
MTKTGQCKNSHIVFHKILINGYIYKIKSLYSSIFSYGPISLKISLLTILVKLSYTEYRKNLSNSLRADTKSLTDGRHNLHLRCSLLLLLSCSICVLLCGMKPSRDFLFETTQSINKGAAFQIYIHNTKTSILIHVIAKKNKKSQLGFIPYNSTHILHDSKRKL